MNNILILLILLLSQSNLIMPFNNNNINNNKILKSIVKMSLSSISKPSTLQLGLTGSIGMGKSSVASHFARLGFPVFDADATVHKLYSKGGAAVNEINKIFPDAVIEGIVNRTILSNICLNTPDALKTLEGIVHPLVASERQIFYENANNQGHLCVIYDIPLLLEKPDSQKVDYVLVVTADAEIQKKRVLSRPNMSPEKFLSILSKQMPDHEKREKADFIIRTDYRGYAPAKAQIARILETLIEAHPNIWTAWKSRGVASSIASTNVSKDEIVSDLFDIVVFDLDDTLAPVGDVLMKAASAMMTFMEQKMPLTAAVAKASLRDTMIAISKENMLITHDLTEVRREALIVLSEDKGDEAMHVDEAIDVFIKVRSNVTAYLYDDVKDCLEWLTNNNVRIGVLTNGNADLSCCSVLSKYISFSIGAGDVGAKKPSPVPFVAVAHRAGVPCNRILFVGDNHNHDVIGAKNVGMKTVYLNRNNDNSLENIEADIVTETLSPNVLREKIREMVTNKKV